MDPYSASCSYMLKQDRSLCLRTACAQKRQPCAQWKWFVKLAQNKQKPVCQHPRRYLQLLEGNTARILRKSLMLQIFLNITQLYTPEQHHLSKFNPICFLTQLWSRLSAFISEMSATKYQLFWRCRGSRLTASSYIIQGTPPNLLKQIK